MFFRHRELDVDRGEQGEDVGLEDCDQELEEGEGEAEGEGADTEELNQPPAVKKKNCVALKKSTSSRWPTIMFIRSRSVSVTGRMMKVEMNSIGVTMM